MSKNTRLAGHALRSEGKPFWWSSQDLRYVRTNALHGADTGDGFALCSCGKASQMLHSNAERKRWHVVHKRTVRGQSASPDSSTEKG